LGSVPSSALAEQLRLCEQRAVQPPGQQPVAGVVRNVLELLVHQIRHRHLGVAGLRKGCFAAFGVDDDARGTERLVVVAELEPGAEVRAGELAAAARAAVARELGLSIDELVFVAKGALEKTTSGKRRHRAVRELYTAGQLAALRRSRVGALA
jgi:acyl-CoA synthetase (AMP-forming)/AMP-acid ligase II